MKIKEIIVPDVDGIIQTDIKEATQSVEDELKLEDAGWINLSVPTGDVISAAARIENLKLSRLYYAKDPLSKQAIRLWTDYSFGSGMSWSVDEENAATQKVLESFWDAKENQVVLSARGQRQCSDKLLVDGEIFFALFLGTQGMVKIRTIDPLEITEIITNPDDAAEVMYYKRAWTNAQGGSKTGYYRSVSNMDNTATNDSSGNSVTKSEDALVYHLTYNTITQRGNPLLLPALDWIKQYRRFLASRVAVMLALARFAWHSKVKGGQTAVDAIKATTHEQEIAAGSQLIENLGSDTQPIKTDTGASNAYQDGRMIKLQFCSAVGWPEQYFGDIATGNLATAKTVELPVAKMCQSYQAVWIDTYKNFDEIVLTYNSIPEDKWYVDRDFPAIAPADYAAMAQSIQQIVQTMPELGDSPDVQQQGLLSIGVNNPGEVLDALSKETKENTIIALKKAVVAFKESIKKE